MSRTPVDWSSGSAKSYKEFCAAHPDIKIKKDDWLSILYGYSEEYKFSVLETGNRVKMHEGLGSFSITKKKRRQLVGKNNEYINLPIDWRKTREKGKKVYNFNHHTEGFYFGWKWFRPVTTISHPELWHFKPTRITSRLLAHYINSDKKYMEIYKNWDSIFRCN